MAHASFVGRPFYSSQGAARAQRNVYSESMRLNALTSPVCGNLVVRRTFPFPRLAPLRHPFWCHYAQRIYTRSSLEGQERIGYCPESTLSPPPPLTTH